MMKTEARAISIARFLSRELLVRLRAFQMRPSLKCPRPANLHVVALVHDYSSYIHADHSSKLSAPVFEHIFTSYTVTNMSHVINEFSFGKHFSEMIQPLDI